MTTTNFPKIDLHLHIDGSLSLPCFQTLASNVGLSMTDAQIRKAVMVSDTCQSLPEYLQCFELPTRLLQTEKALTLSTFDLIRNLEAQGLFYAELRFAPQHYTCLLYTSLHKLSPPFDPYDFLLIGNLPVAVRTPADK